MTSPTPLPNLIILADTANNGYWVHSVKQRELAIVERLRYILLKSSNIDEMDKLITKLIAELEKIK